MRRLLVALLVIATVGAGLFIGVRAAVNALTGRFDTGCSFGSYETSTDQAATASTMVGVVERRRLPRRAAVLVLAAALQESKLTNLPAGSGDRDSVGVLQQRPSQGWGSAAKLADVGFATDAFLDKLVTVAGWRTEPLADVIQHVQISIDGALYAKHEAKAQALADGLSGRTTRGVTCHFPAPDRVAEGQVVAGQVSRQLGIGPPSVRGRTVTATGAGWPTVAWFVANADRLGIDRVSYAGSRWTRSDGWADDASVDSRAVVAALAG